MLTTHLLNYTTTNQESQVKKIKSRFPPISLPQINEHPPQLNLHSHAPNRCEGLAEIFSGVNQKIKQCGKKYITKVCVSCNVKYVAPLRCHHRLCPTCAKKRARKWFHKLVRVEWGKAIALTLTLAASDDLGSLITTAINAFRKFCRHFKIKRAFRGIEIVRRYVPKGQGKWSVHIHGLISYRPFWFETVREFWQKEAGAEVTKFDEIPIVSPGKIWDVCKYVTKGISRLRPEDREEVDCVIKGRRLLAVYGFTKGELPKLDILETILPNKCLFCGGKLWFGGIISRAEVEILKAFCKVVVLYDDS